jgi:DNA gyrase subunit B
MDKELFDRGIKGTEVRALALGREPFRGDELKNLVHLMGELDAGLQIVERRGYSLRNLIPKAVDGLLPVVHITLAGQEHWFARREDADAFVAAEREKRGVDLVLTDDGEQGTNGQARSRYSRQDLHEIIGVNRNLEKLKQYGLGLADLTPQERIAGREPPVKFELHHGDSVKVLPHLRELVTEIRRLGERGITVTRFKGLGEMNPEQLWETTLDPKNRTLLQVRLDDAMEADEMFRVLMGEKVEPRRDFITKHALEVKEIDYHGA